MRYLLLLTLATLTACGGGEPVQECTVTAAAYVVTPRGERALTAWHESKSPDLYALGVSRANGQPVTVGLFAFCPE
jgi:hypothetical protein